MNKLKEAPLDNCPLPEIKIEYAEVEPVPEHTEAEKKAKNKVAAKESRDRKKMYIAILEKKTEAL